MKKRTLAVLILAGVAAMTTFGLVLVLNQPPKGPEADETVVVEKQTIDDTIEVSGHLKARQEQEIRPAQGGQVVEVSTAANASVVPGLALARLDTSEQDQAIADLEFQADQERFSGNQRKVALLEGKIESQKRAREALTLRAHMTGRISRWDIKVGDVLKSGDSYGRVIDVQTLVADVEVTELDIPRIRVGQRAEFRFPALPGLVVQGTVASFPAEARINDRGLTVLDVRLVVDHPPPQLLPAYSFQAVIKAGDPKEVLVVDSRAISYLEGKPRVERQDALGQWQTIPVETEGFGSGFVRLVTGVQAGDVLKVPRPNPERPS